LGRELLAQLFGHIVFEVVRDEELAQHGAGAFVSQDEAAAIHLPHDAFPVILAGIGTGAQDGGDAPAAAADGAGGAQHVGGILYPGAGKPFAQVHGAFPHQAGGIEMDILHAGTNLPRGMVQDGLQMVFRSLQDVESRSAYIPGLFPLHHAPVRFGCATVYYQLLHFQK
jgi:hypothetical protein